MCIIQKCKKEPIFEKLCENHFKEYKSIYGNTAQYIDEYIDGSPHSIFIVYNYYDIADEDNIVPPSMSHVVLTDCDNNIVKWLDDEEIPKEFWTRTEQKNGKRKKFSKFNKQEHIKVYKKYNTTCLALGPQLVNNYWIGKAGIEKVKIKRIEKAQTPKKTKNS